MRYNSLNVLCKPALWCVSGKAEYSMDDLKRHRTYSVEAIGKMQQIERERRINALLT